MTIIEGNHKTRKEPLFAKRTDFVSEARAEVKLNICKPLFLVTLDSQKAFDVVNHTVLLDKLYETGIHPALWRIVKDLYSGLTSKVKWLGELRRQFIIRKGVRQGGIVSTFFLQDLHQSMLDGTERT